MSDLLAWVLGVRPVPGGWRGELVGPDEEVLLSPLAYDTDSAAFRWACAEASRQIQETTAPVPRCRRSRSTTNE